MKKKYNFTWNDVKEFVKKWYPKVKKFILHHLKELVITILAMFFLAILKGCWG